MALTVLVLVTYDVEVTSPGGARRLRHIANACRDYGQRVQFSVFEIEVTADQWVLLRARLLSAMDPARDSLRFHMLGTSSRSRIEHVGAKPATDLNGLLIV